jgi:hypothetical protein
MIFGDHDKIIHILILKTFNRRRMQSDHDNIILISTVTVVKFSATNAVFLLNFLCQKSVKELPFAWKY